MEYSQTILVRPDEQGKKINLTNVERIELELVPGSQGYEYSPEKKTYVTFNKHVLAKELEVFPGYGGMPGKNGQISYVRAYPNIYESIFCTDGSGACVRGIDGYVKVVLYKNYDDILNN